MPGKKTKFTIDILIMAFLIVLNFFFLPTFGFWSVYDRSPKLIYSQSTQNLLSYQHPPLPQLTSKRTPNLLAPYYILIDNDTNTVLLSRQENERIFPASITKLATALTALNVYPLDEIITIKEEYGEGKIMELQLGEKISVRSLVTSILVYSANDAAFTLASHHPNGLQGFIDQMNLLVKKYNLTSTHFTNFDGIHDGNHYSTVYELAQLGRISIKNPVVREVVKTKSVVVSDVSRNTEHNLTSTNELLDIVPEIEGLKTGWTPEAGGCFIGLLNIDGHQLVSVVAQSEDRFGDTLKLVNWAKDNLTWTTYGQ
jgi:D-alanyl-D-alanine carboxypeptidase (penicillin-binding protein 5/6)